MRFSFHQELDNGLGIESLQIRIGLSRPDENNGLTSDVGHGYSRANLAKSSRMLNINS